MLMYLLYLSSDKRILLNYGHYLCCKMNATNFYKRTFILGKMYNTGWTVEGLNPGGGMRFSLLHTSQALGLPKSLYNGCQRFVSGVIAAEA
jgi:hypothetical protein